MAQYEAELDGVLVALADPTRRAVVTRLGRGPATVGDLARPFPMTLPSFMKHVRTLETHGLIRTTKSGRVRTCELDRARQLILLRRDNVEHLLLVGVAVGLLMSMGKESRATEIERAK